MTQHALKNAPRPEPAAIVWLKRIFSIKVLSFVVAVITAWFAYDSFVREQGGDLQAFYDGEPIADGFERCVVVGIDGLSADLASSGIPIAATYRNTGKYSFKNFHLEYEVPLGGMTQHDQITVASSFISITENHTAYISYDAGTLASQARTPSPFKTFLVRSDGHATISSLVSYDGLDTPLHTAIEIQWFLRPGVAPTPQGVQTLLSATDYAARGATVDAYIIGADGSVASFTYTPPPASEQKQEIEPAAPDPAVDALDFDFSPESAPAEAAEPGKMQRFLSTFMQISRNALIMMLIALGLMIVSAIYKWITEGWRAAMHEIVSLLIFFVVFFFVCVGGVSLFITFW